MNKTLHKKLTEKPFPGHLQALSFDHQGGTVLQEKGLMQEIAKDLLQPRPQAIARLLEMTREL